MTHVFQEEGIAYRGRILVDISTNMGPAPEDQEPVTDLEQDEVDRVMVSAPEKLNFLMIRP